ncbi:hypothetical protein [Stutzerimonas zhaodongensis]|uniref:hypothetical protein n=1 Tax=Stutzerimonas zhaodongensis TaxID=1176257 RepID=UPI002103E9E8|nr:hypothetical protein [Stutzerimonas zhaodongensis]MCQ2031179.1 hypothetical protein [Stutzerimonas zhaodongensis]
MLDIFEYGGEWSSWKITPAPAYLPDMLLYALSYFIIPSPAQRIVFVCMAQSALLAWACIRLGCAIKPYFSTNAKIFVIVILSFVVLVSANSSMWLFFNSTNNHFAALLFPALSMSFIFGYWDSKRTLDAALIVLCVVAGAASTPVFALSFTLPALLLALGCIVLPHSDRKLRNIAAQIIILILTGHLLASAFNAVFISFDAFSGRAPITAEAAMRSVYFFIAATKITFGTENPFTFALAVFTVVALVWVITDHLLRVKMSMGSAGDGDGYGFVWIKIPSGNSRFSISLLFLLFVFSVNTIGSVVSGGFADPWGYRYLAFPIALGLLLWVVALDSRAIFGKTRATYFAAFLLAAAAGIAAVSIKPLYLGAGRASYTSLLELGMYNTGDAVGQCIDQEAENGFVFQAGVADFWNARGVAFKTHSYAHILPVTNDLTPFFHMVSLGPLLEPNKYGINAYNFFIMRKAGTTTQFDVKSESTGQMLPSPTKIVDCKNTDTELWLYTDMSLDDTMNKHIDRFLAHIGILRNYSINGADLPGLVGRSDATYRIASSINDAPGFLSYGPYIKVPAGRYKVTLSYESTEYGNRWDAGRFNDPENSNVVASGDFTVGEGEIEFYFDTKEAIEQFEVRSIYGGDGNFSLHKLKISAVNDGFDIHKR